MKKKIYLQDFVDALVRQEALGKREADIFMRAFFDTIEQGLEQDKIVKIKGMGTFKVVAVGDRESIDVNTGERIQIVGHSKVTFTPDPKMKEMINRPFSHFEPVNLDEQMDAAALDAIDKECGQYNMVPDEEQTEEAGLEETIDEPETVTEPEAEEVIQPVGTSGCPLPEEAGKEEEQVQTEMERQSSVEREQEMTSQAQSEEKVAVSMEDVPPVTRTVEEKPDVVTFTRMQSRQPFDEPTDLDDGGTIEYTYRETSKPAKRRWWKIVLLVLCQLMIMLVCYFAGYYQVLCPCNYSYLEKIWNTSAGQAVSHQAVVRPVPAARPEARSSASEERDTALQQQTATPQKQEQKQEPKRGQQTEKAGKREEAGGQTSPNSTGKEPAQKSEKPEYHKVKAGDNLYKISRKYYGTDKMVPSIIRRNNLKDANNITKGMNLYLP